MRPALHRDLCTSLLRTMYSPGPVLHDVTLTSGWPIPLASVANALSLPLPPGLQGTEELLESASQSLTNEKLSDRSTYSNLPMSHSTDSDSPASLLVTAIPFVLNAARQLRDLIQMNNLNSAYVRPTIPIWFSLIRTLAYIYSEDLLTMFVSRSLPLLSRADRNLEAKLRTFSRGRLTRHLKTQYWTGGLLDSCPW